MKKTKKLPYVLLAILLTALAGTFLIWTSDILFNCDTTFVVASIIILLIGAIYVPYIQYKQAKEELEQKEMFKTHLK